MEILFVATFKILILTLNESSKFNKAYAACSDTLQYGKQCTACSGCNEGAYSFTTSAHMFLFQINKYQPCYF